MRTVAKILHDLQIRGVVLYLSEGELAYRAPKSALTSEDRIELAAQREAIMAYLAAMSARFQGPIKLVKSTKLRPSLLQELWWHWYGRPPRQLNQERLPLVQVFRDTQLTFIKNAIYKLISRHDTLRSSLREEEGELRISLNSPGEFTIEFEEFTVNGNQSEQEAKLKVRASEFSMQQLPLDGKWLIRAKVIGFSPGSFVLIFVFHHIIVDAAALLLILAELEALIKDQETPLPKPVQFNDYASWERFWMASPERKPLIDYWANRLGSQSALVAPESKQKLSWCKGLKVDYKFTFDSPIVKRINAFAIKQKTSIFNILLTIFGISLARWSGVSRFPVRCIGDLRTSPELAPIVGYLVCSDIVEIAVSPNVDFASLLKDNEIEYHSSIKLRVPTMLRHPMHSGGQGIEDPRHIAATINMFSINWSTSDSKTEGEVEPLRNWPPEITQSPVEPWPILLPSIYLRLLDYGDFMEGSIELNKEQLNDNEQKFLLENIFETLHEFLL